MEDFFYITIRTIFFQVLSLILMFTFVKTPDDYIIYAIISMISANGANILNIFYRKKYCKIKFTKDMEFKKHIKPIIVLFIMLSAQTIFNSSDITMLGLMKGDLEVGLYSTAVKVSNLICQAFNSVLWVIMPQMTRYFTNSNYENINEMLKKVLGTMLVFALPCVVGCMCLSEEIILIIAGKEYLGAVSALRILLVSFVFTLLGEGFLGNMVLLPAKKESLYMKICCISTILNLILNSIFIPIGGTVVAAVTTAISTLIMLILLIITKEKNIKLDYIYREAKDPSIGCIFIVIYCIFMKHIMDNLIILTISSIIGSVILYFGIMILLKNKICNEAFEWFRQKIFK